MLIQVGSNIWLYNSNNPIIENINPVKFDNIEEYYDFVKWQNQTNRKCPVLHVQQVYNTQGEAEFHLRNTPLQPFHENKIIIESTSTTKILDDHVQNDLFVNDSESEFTKYTSYL
jgi:hypothetical protein